MARTLIAALIAALLIPAGSHATGPKPDLESSLLIAARTGDGDVVKALAVRGVDLETRDERGARALHLAAAYGHLEVVEALISAGADVDATGPIGNTALHYAAQEGHAEVAALLVAAGLSADASSEYGTTPRSLAAGWGHTDVVAALSPVSPVLDRTPGPSGGQWLLAGLAGLLTLACLPILGLAAGHLMAQAARLHAVR